MVLCLSLPVNHLTEWANRSPVTSMSRSTSTAPEKPHVKNNTTRIWLSSPSRFSYNFKGIFYIREVRSWHHRQHTISSHLKPPMRRHHRPFHCFHTHTHTHSDITQWYQTCYLLVLFTLLQATRLTFVCHRCGMTGYQGEHKLQNRGNIKRHWKTISAKKKYE